MNEKSGSCLEGANAAIGQYLFSFQGSIGCQSEAVLLSEQWKKLCAILAPFPSQTLMKNETSSNRKLVRKENTTKKQYGSFFKA